MLTKKLDKALWREMHRQAHSPNQNPNLCTILQEREWRAYYGVISKGGERKVEVN
jgi:hypothetical protein